MAVILILVIMLCFCSYKIGTNKVINRLKDISTLCNNNGERFYDRVFNEFLRNK
jgi:hypothetical protein